MRKIFSLSVPCLGLLCVLFMAVQFTHAQGSLQVVDVDAVPESAPVGPGAQFKVAIHAHITPGYHINDHKPTLDYLIPTRFELAPSDQFTLKDVAYPKGNLIKFPFSDVPLSVYEGKLELSAVVVASKTVPPGAYTLKAKFAYQACSEHACLPPKSVPVELTVKVVP